MFDIGGRLMNRNVSSYVIDWDKRSRSIVQYRVKQFLRPYWFTQIVFEEFPVFGTRLKVDILNATLKVAVEVNGNQHETYNPFFHRGNPANYLKGFQNDEKKFRWLKRNGYKLLEINENEVGFLNREFFLTKFGITL